jgi:hypothetical protein
MALTDSLVSYWELEETSGTRVDSHGSNDLTDNNTVGSATGKQGNGADFERDNSELLSITDAAQSGLDITGNMTISLWMKPETLPSTTSGSVEYYFVSRYDSTSGGWAWRTLWQTSSTLNRVFLSTSTNGTTATNGIVDTSGLSSAGVWYFLTFVKSSTTFTMYINGSSVGTATVTSSIYNGNDNFAIGANSNGNSGFFDGIIDEVGIWSRALTSSEVSELYNSGAGLSYAGLTGGGSAFVPRVSFIM